LTDSTPSYDFKNKRIGIIGGGSSAIQIIPQLQKLPGTHLSCFVRSKTWISRPFGDVAMEKLDLKDTHCKSTAHCTTTRILTVVVSPEQKARFANDPNYYLQFRTLIERDANSVHSLTLKGSEIQKDAREDFTALMAERLAKKPHILKSLLPTFSVGCRRLTPGPGYLEALVEDNVDFIDTPIAKATATGIVLKNGEEKELDVLVCATGFQASAPPPFPVIGKAGQTMKEKFEPYAETYLSLATDGFPNYFMMLGPNAAIGTGTLTTMMEMTGDYIVKCIRKLQKENITKMEVQKRRVDDFSAVIDKYFKSTVYLDSCSSWYRSNGGVGDRITGLWPGSALHAMECLRSPRWEDYNYVYEGEESGEECNRLGWLGNGWSIAQVDSKEGEIAHFLQPNVVDIPAEPFPEDTESLKQRPFSY
jgi:cation diffusion facilitator CzcD-associated flavoprotein CzcO